jgi:hypothetical protein
MSTVKIPSRWKRETPYDKLNMNEIGQLLGLDKAGVLSLMFKGKIRFTKVNDKRVARRADVMACKAKLEAEQA